MPAMNAIAGATVSGIVVESILYQNTTVGGFPMSRQAIEPFAVLHNVTNTKVDPFVKTRFLTSSLT